jgi:hypothetical protein
MSLSKFDSIVQRLQYLGSFNLHQVTIEGNTVPWWEINSNMLIEDLVLSDLDLDGQIQTLTLRVAFWGRMAAQAERVWQVKEREYRIWKAKWYIFYRSQKEVKYTEKEIDSLIRTNDDYSKLYNEVERAEEAYNILIAVVEAWRVKKDIVKTAVYRKVTEEGSKLSI